MEVVYVVNDWTVHINVNMSSSTCGPPEYQSLSKVRRDHEM